MASVGGDIYLMHADGQHSMPLAVGRGNDEDPVWSSDGTRLVYAHSTIGNSINEIVVVRADGEHRHVIARQGGLFAGEPAWSPRNAIAYSAYGLRQRKGIVVVTDPSGSRRLTLFSKRLTEFHGLGWSPGGLQLVLDEMHWTHPGGGREIEFGRIWIVGADGRHRQALTSGRFDDRDPVWSPDGRWVGFTRCKGDRCQVMIVGSSGGQVRPVPTSLRTAHLDGWTR
jgi:Tol biopolymer transport system component